MPGPGMTPTSKRCAEGMGWGATVPSFWKISLHLSLKDKREFSKPKGEGKSISGKETAWPKKSGVSGNEVRGQKGQDHKRSCKPGDGEATGSGRTGMGAVRKDLRLSWQTQNVGVGR